MHLRALALVFVVVFFFENVKKTFGACITVLKKHS